MAVVMGPTYDVVVVGGGHNGLVAATYLAKAGKKVLLLEAREHLGGASISYQAFPEFSVKLSRYSYLVSLFPDQIKVDLGLKFRTLSRRLSSYTPVQQDGRDIGLLVERHPGQRTQDSFREVTGSDSEFRAWQNFYSEIEDLAKYLAPTLLQPLKNSRELKDSFAHPSLWNQIFEQPIGQSITEIFNDDIIRGVVLTDALVGTFSSINEMQANTCFLYHIIGNGSGEWRVPQGGMGAIADELESVARGTGVSITLNQRVIEISGDSTGIEVKTTDGSKFSCRDLIWCADDRALSRILGEPVKSRRDGSQIKINMLLRELPLLRSGIPPKDAFAGTFHIDESAIQLESAFQLANSGVLPSVIPSEVYCHSITDPSIVGESNLHTLTLFAFHTPASLFENERQMKTSQATERIIAGINSYLVTPLEDVLAYDSDGKACIEVKSPLDLEDELDLPRGNIFHGDLTMPFADPFTEGRWGSESSHSNIFIGGASALRGGGVSGISGHNAAFAIINRK